MSLEYCCNSANNDLNMDVQLSVIKSGASMLHIHARDDLGVPAWHPEIFAHIIKNIRKYHPEVVICVTTSGRVFSEFDKRSAVLFLDGEVKPDMASLTLGSMNFPREATLNPPETIKKLACIMGERGIIPELEIFEPGMLNYALYLSRKKILSEKCYVNFILGSLGTSPARVFDLANLVRDIPDGGYGRQLALEDFRQR